MTSDICVVTGAFGYTGRYIARRLIELHYPVKTLISHSHRSNPFGDRLSVARLDFENRAMLVESLRGARVLYNTYWVRFDYEGTSFDQATANTNTLLECAREAGVERIVHVSVTNPSLNSPLPYFRGKARVEQLVQDSGLSYAIVRPALIFGAGDILINNIGWLLRHFPVFAIPGAGNYKVQPIAAEDLADIMIGLADKRNNMVVDALGPDILTFEQLVKLIATAVGSRALLLKVPPQLSLLSSRLLNNVVKDVLLTDDELQGLMSNLLTSESPPNANTHIEDWLMANTTSIGVKYASELARHFPQTQA